MPIDTRPLTLGRRITLLLVLLGLFAASLGFAQYLVSRHHELVIVTAEFPTIFKTPVHSYDHMPGLITAWEARDANVVRRIALFKFEADLPTNRALQNEAADLFTALYGEEPQTYDDARLDTLRAVEVSGVVGQHAAAWLRLARATPGQAVAFCYSGPDPLPDQDSKAFNDLATRCIRISVVDAPASPK